MHSSSSKSVVSVRISKLNALIPLSLFTNGKGLVKIDIALARGKRQFDKRQDIKQKDAKRDLDRLNKNY